MSTDTQTPDKKREKINQSLQKIGDFIRKAKIETLSGSPEDRIDLLRSIRESREALYRELETLETILSSTLFVDSEEEFFIRDTTSLLRYSVLSLDTALDFMSKNIQREIDRDSSPEK